MSLPVEPGAGLLMFQGLSEDEGGCWSVFNEDLVLEIVAVVREQLVGAGGAGPFFPNDDGPSGPISDTYIWPFIDSKAGTWRAAPPAWVCPSSRKSRKLSKIMITTLC